MMIFTYLIGLSCPKRYPLLSALIEKARGCGTFSIETRSFPTLCPDAEEVHWNCLIHQR